MASMAVMGRMLNWSGEDQRRGQQLPTEKTSSLGLKSGE